MKTEKINEVENTKGEVIEFAKDKQELNSMWGKKEQTEGTALKIQNDTQTAVDTFGFDRKSNVIIDTTSTIKDKKQLFNIENNDVDFMLNDEIGQTIIIKDIILKRFEKPLKQENIVTDEETGEILKDKEVSIITILVDDKGKTHLTKSKIFNMKLMSLARAYDKEFMKTLEEGIEIQITESSVKNSQFKALSFELK